MTHPSDFRAAVRRGRKTGVGKVVLHVLARSDAAPPRFGFIVTKSVGGAVARNLVRRRLRAACREVLPGVPLGTDVVVRALPGCDQIGWVSLYREIAEGIGTSMTTSAARAR